LRSHLKDSVLAHTRQAAVREIVKEPIGHIGFESAARFGFGESVMSKKMMIAVMAGTISLLADHLASARGGGAHGGLHAMPGAAVRATAPFGAVARSNNGAAGTSSGNGGHMVGPNLGSILLGNGGGPVSGPTIPSNVGASPAGVRGASPGSANGGGLNNLGINPNGTGMSVTDASPPVAGTNTAGTALSSGLPTSGRSEHLSTGQSADKAKRPRTDEDGVNDSEAAKIDRVVKSICTGC
jgi:hypothetical protein